MKKKPPKTDAGGATTSNPATETTGKSDVGASEHFIAMQQGWVQDAADLLKDMITLVVKGRIMPSEWAKPVAGMLEKSAKRANDFASYLKSLG